MDTLCFEKKFVKCSWSERNFACAVTIINGRKLLEVVKEYELPYTREEGHEDIADGYEYQLAGELYLQLTDKSRRMEEDEVTLLICSDCLEECCWPFVVHSEETDDFVIWKNFDNPFRSENRADGLWDYSGFGPFCFDKAAYMRELEKLRTFGE